MFGYLASKSFSDSPFWEYASVSIFREIGSDVQVIKAKIFNKNIINNLRDINLLQQIEFELSYVVRKTRKYTNVTMLKTSDFETCSICGRPSEECGVCDGVEAERLDGQFVILKVDKMDYGIKYILAKEDLFVTYILWLSHPFYEASEGFKVNDHVDVIGWRSEDRITNLRKFAKVENL